MKRKHWPILFILIVLSLFTEGSLQTTFSPTTTDLCGPFPTSLDLTATNIQNNEDFNLTNVKATLIADPNDGGLIISNPLVELGDIPVSGQSPIEPSWIVQCDPTFSGEYTLYINYTASEDYFSVSPEQATIIVHEGDTTPPTVLNHLPVDKIITPYLTLEITTDEDATCKYSTVSGVHYDNMISTFGLTGETSHTQVITDLTDNRYRYYVKCKDIQGNKAIEDYEIIFDVDVPPTAQIQLSKSSPIGLGTVEVTLTTSEEVRPIPSLSYSFSGTRTSIPLSGHGTTWNGFMILQQSDNNEVGSFEFSGIDLTGNTGTVITRGNIFIVDTIPPEAPAHITATDRGENSIRLEWHHSEEVDHYVIYRSTENEDFSYYRTTAKKSFVDTNVIAGRTYYYSVSAVDLAGNEGDLSNEVSLTVGQIQIFQPETKQETREEIADKKEMIEEIDTAIVSIETILDDINTIRSDFNERNEEIVNLFGIQDTLKEKKVDLLKLKEELGILKSEDLSNTVIERDLKDITERIKKIQSEIPKEIKYGETLVFDLDVSKEYISAAIDKLLKIEDLDMSDSSQEEYLSKAEEIQENLKITVEAKQFIIIYSDDAKKELLLVTKEITAKGDRLRNVVLIENIPKSLVQNTNEILFDDGLQFTIVDSALKIDLDDLDTLKFNYIIDDYVDPDNTKKITTVLLPALQEMNNKKTSNKITGFFASTFPENVSFYDTSIIIGVFLIIALVIYSLVYSRKNAAVVSYSPQTLLSRKIGERLSEIIENLTSVLIKIINKVFGIGTRKTVKGHISYSKHIKLKNTTLPSLIKKVDAYINKIDYNLATKSYCALTSRYESTPYKKRSKRMKKQISRIHKKMSLLTKIDLLRVCLERKNPAEIQPLSKEIIRLHKSLLKKTNKQEKKFLNYVKLFCDNISK